tara:strand:- start:195376 stop:197394 length:2019 start_codon:yes stop_codon:yes gene_type:complete
VQLGHIIEGLHRQHQVDVLSVRRDDQGHVERLGGTRYLRVPLPDEDRTSQIEVFRRALRRQLDGADYDVVHFRDGWSGITALEMQASQGYATVFDLARSPMAEPVLTDLATATELERAEQTCVRRSDLILAPTEPSRQYLAGFTSASKIHVVPPGVNVDRFDWEALNLDRAPIILYLGSLTPGRGVRVLLRSMLDVARVSNAVLVLAGPATTSFTESLETAVHDLGLEGRVRLLGEIPHELAPAVISRATVCVAPGAAELTPKPTALFPTKILEYMACRRAVVAPARGTVKMLFRDGEEGLMFTPGAPEDLAAKLLLLLRDSKLRNKVANGGYEMVRANCTASGTRRSLRRAYTWLAEQEKFSERFGQAAGDARLAPITELGLDLILRQQADGVSSEEFASEEFAADELVADSGESRVASPTMEPGEVTVVEMLPRRHQSDDSADQRAGSNFEVEDSNSSIEIEIVGEGIEEWEVPLLVIEDTGSLELGLKKPQTVVTAPMDDSLVTGELQGKTPRPEHTRPLSESIFDSAATGIAQPGEFAKIPPANLAHKQMIQGRSSPLFSKPPQPQEKTRVLAVDDLEEIPTNQVAAVEGPGQKNANPPAIPPIKISRPTVAPLAGSGLSASQRAEHSAKTRIVLASAMTKSQEPGEIPSSPATGQSDSGTPSPDDRG